MSQPKVTLISWTPEPLKVLAWVCKIYEQKAVDSLARLPELGLKTEADMIKFLEPFLAEPHQTFVEYIQTVWLLENVSRAFQQQLTRHRQASYAIQSLRVHDVGRFSESSSYTMPSTIKNPAIYRACMNEIEEMYRVLVNSGENLEDARGILPLNVHSTITMRVDFNSLRGILRGRLCLTAQEEARRVGYLMKEQVALKMGQFFGDLLQPPCHKIYGGKCTREKWYCGVPLYEASMNPVKFQEWFDRTGGKPDGTRVPTNIVVLPEDLAVIKQAKERNNDKSEHQAVG